ncbi:MAG: MauE/DoxX family redox-associated membrane protein [Acidobacteriota bacterium]
MSDDRTSRRSLTSILSLAGAFVLGAILIVATFGKLGDPIVFVEQIHNEGLDFLLSANTVALLALAIETFLGLALLLGVRNRGILIPSAALVVFFISLTGWNYYLVLSGQRDASYDCGCFGVFLHRNAVAAFWQDLPMLGIPLILALLDRKAFRRPLAQWKITVSLVGAVAVLAYTVYGVGLPTAPLPGSGPASASEVLTFQPSAQFELLIGGEPDAEGRVLECPETLQLLLLSKSLAKPLVLDIRSSRVMELDGRSALDGSAEVTLPRDPDLQPIGSFSVGSEGLSFEYDGRPIALRNRG